MSNLCHRLPYQKQPKQREGNKPTPAQRRRWEKIRCFGCIICHSSASIHHCFTGAGGRKDHDKVIALCHFHHQGEQGIHSLGRSAWQARYGTEAGLLKRTAGLLREISGE